MQKKIAQFVPVIITSAPELTTGEKKVLQNKMEKKYEKFFLPKSFWFTVKDGAHVKVLDLLIEASSHLDPIFNRLRIFVLTFKSSNISCLIKNIFFLDFYI